VARTAVVALGGNALVAEDQAGTYDEQRVNAAAMAVPICELLDAGWRVVVVHGNGPQVGNLAIQQELGRAEVPAMPLFSLGAMTEGQLGSLIAIALYRRCGRRQPIAALLSHVIVDIDDPAFDNPTKPIGPFFAEEAAGRLARERRWDVSADAGRGFRRVVASPQPKGFVEIGAIRALLDSGHVVVTGGGGGIPVGRRDGVWDGVDAVIDKDYAAAELALQLEAEALVLITAVAAVQLDFGKPTQRPLTGVGVDEVEKHLAAGQFPPGSMGPKVGAATRFVRHGGELAVITNPQLVVRTMSSQDGPDQPIGTRITRVASRNEVSA
jgi:carbamate kinase